MYSFYRLKGCIISIIAFADYRTIDPTVIAPKKTVAILLKVNYTENAKPLKKIDKQMYDIEGKCLEFWKQTKSKMILKNKTQYYLIIYYFVNLILAPC